MNDSQIQIFSSSEKFLTLFLTFFWYFTDTQAYKTLTFMKVQTTGQLL